MLAAIRDSSPATISQDSRRANRYRSKVAVDVLFNGRTIPGRIFDLSMSGMSITVERILLAPVGSSVVIKSTEIGVIDGVVRWSKNNRLGIQFSQSSASVAQVAAYFRFFHKDVAVK